MVNAGDYLPRMPSQGPGELVQEALAAAEWQETRAREARDALARAINQHVQATEVMAKWQMANEVFSGEDSYSGRLETWEDAVAHDADWGREGAVAYLDRARDQRKIYYTAYPSAEVKVGLYAAEWEVARTKETYDASIVLDASDPSRIEAKIRHEFAAANRDGWKNANDFFSARNIHTQGDVNANDEEMSPRRGASAYRESAKRGQELYNAHGRPPRTPAAAVEDALRAAEWEVTRTKEAIGSLTPGSVQPGLALADSKHLMAVWVRQKSQGLNALLNEQRIRTWADVENCDKIMGSNGPSAYAESARHQQEIYNNDYPGPHAAQQSVATAMWNSVRHHPARQSTAQSSHQNYQPSSQDPRAQQVGRTRRQK